MSGLKYVNLLTSFVILIMHCFSPAQCVKSDHISFYDFSDRLLDSSKIRIKEGNDLQVKCKANVTKSPKELKWKRPGETETKDNFHKLDQMRQDKETSLRILKVNGSDAGRYVCEVLMADGTEESAVIYVMVRRHDQEETCPTTQFKCKTTKLCMFARFVCDGYNDCDDGSDEECGDEDPCKGKFRCKNERCVDKKLLCNGLDDCMDMSDENLRKCLSPPSQSPPSDNSDSHFSWLKTTVYIAIASTLGLVILVSSVVILVYRGVIHRRRERGIHQALQRLYQHQQMMQCGNNFHSSGPDDRPSDQQPFLGPQCPEYSHAHFSNPNSYPHRPGYGNIIVNVNNGVQYRVPGIECSTHPTHFMPDTQCSVFMASPPPYSEVTTQSNQKDENAPPAYSSICADESTNSEENQGSRNNHVANQSLQGGSASAYRNVPLAVHNILVSGSHGRGSRERLGQEGREANDNSGVRRCPVTTRVNALQRSPDVGEEAGAQVIAPGSHPSARSMLSPQVPPPGTFPNINISSEFLESLFATRNQQLDSSHDSPRSCRQCQSRRVEDNSVECGEARLSCSGTLSTSSSSDSQSSSMEDDTDDGAVSVTDDLDEQNIKDSGQNQDSTSSSRKEVSESDVLMSLPLETEAQNSTPIIVEPELTQTIRDSHTPSADSTICTEAAAVGDISEGDTKREISSSCANEEVEKNTKDSIEGAQEVTMNNSEAKNEDILPL